MEYCTLKNPGGGIKKSGGPKPGVKKSGGQKVRGSKSQGVKKSGGQKSQVHTNLKRNVF